MNQRSDALATMEKCTRAQDLRVFIALMRRMNYQNTVNITQKALAKALGMTRPNISTALKRLTDDGVITKVEDADSGSWVYQVSPSIAWRGDMTQHPDATFRPASGMPQVLTAEPTP